MTSRPPAPLDDALYAELRALADEVARACPPYRLSRRDVRVGAPWPKSVRWFWEVFGHSALTQRCIAPDDPAMREAALDLLREWGDTDARYLDLARRVTDAHHLLAFDDDELVLLAHGLARQEEDPPLVVLRAPTGATEDPDVAHLASSALRYLVSGVLKGLWSELVRVFVATRPPLAMAQPFPRVAPAVSRATVDGVSLWVSERPVRDRAGFALYFAHDDAETVDAWLSREGLGDQLLV